jgi:PAS domain S-box-containing protein
VISVLLVDDEEAFLNIAEIFLMKDGDIRVLKAKSVKAAFEMLKQEHVDVILSDYEMPESNGIEFLMEIRKSGNDIPFIMLTGKGWVQVASKAMNFGVDHYMRKGDNPKELFENIRQKIRAIVQERSRRRVFEEQYRQYRNFFETIPLASFLLNHADSVTDANPAACDLLGYTRNELKGLHPNDIFPEDLSGPVIPARIIDTPEGSYGQLYCMNKNACLRRKDGTCFNAEIIITEWYAPGEKQINILVNGLPGTE